ncbi:prolipoprotein diacylglyceryl transferase [Membranicola marinus]|uniref:Phosphatidylglycerol--prolipoprotein diacylglyceryl transferase n=1 Tax=Membranihabitans marinus TaxID=1227546 RepID=A0A953L5H6_9BACT|nr:prolipoprotein diacylglyceryl transferase [Membranihabitans marinus]MBY5956592.1 prolipoprotein diacylglyceryl transferase [Membranihabitans marinus]
MLAYIDWNVDPNLFLFIQWYNVFFAAGFIIGFFIMKRIFQREGANTDWLEPLLLYLVIATVLGARIGHCVFYDWDYFSQHPLEIILPFQFEPEFRFQRFRGLASHGGAIGILIALWLFSRRVSKTPYLWILDRIVIPITLAGMFIRLGNLMNHEIIGTPTTVPWAFKFELVDDIPRHPVQLYESISYLFIFFFLYYLYWKTEKRKQLGYIFGWFMILLWTARFIMEFFKRSQGGFETLFNLGLSTGQLLSIPFVIIGIILLFYNMKYEPDFRPEITIHT